jgi:hypothetical protein
MIPATTTRSALTIVGAPRPGRCNDVRSARHVVQVDERAGMSRPLTFRRSRRRATGPRGARLRRPLIVAVSVLSEAIPLWLRGYRIGGNVVVRCRDGHLFTTLWIPGASLKALRFSGWRLQRCPVGHHWSIVTPVRRSDLSKQQERSASKRRDVRIP